MICPSCHATVPDDATSCPVCGGSLEGAPSETDAASDDFIFCEGCGARLMPSDRTCPKCGRPAPGILSTQSASSDLAAGRTASFPRLSPGMIAESAPSTAPRILAESLDPEVTNVIDGDKLSEAGAVGGAAKSSVHRSSPRAAASADDYRRPRRGRWVALGLVVVLLAGGAWFVVEDPMGVMPGVYASIDKAAADMFPSREIGESANPQQSTADEGGDAAPSGDGQQDVSDKALSDDQAYVTLSGIYDRIGRFRDDFGTVLDDYSGYFIASSLESRKSGSRSAYDMRDSLEKTMEQLDDVKLVEDSPYTEDVDNLKKLASWMYNRVDVICQCWDISLSFPDGSDVAEHRSEIAAPLVEVGDVGSGNENTRNLDKYFSAWKPERKS